MSTMAFDSSHRIQISRNLQSTEFWTPVQAVFFYKDIKNNVLIENIWFQHNGVPQDFRFRICQRFTWMKCFIFRLIGWNGPYISTIGIIQCADLKCGVYWKQLQIPLVNSKIDWHIKRLWREDIFSFSFFIADHILAFFFNEKMYLIVEAFTTRVN